MAIVHDAWVFDAEVFAKRAIDFAKALADQPEVGYREVRASAIKALDEGGWNLADRYGGWDRASVVDELPEDAPGTSDDVAFCFTLLLYGELHTSELHECDGQAGLGLRTQWRDCLELLEELHWTSAERELLVKGHGFGELVDRYLPETGLTERQLSEIRRIGNGIQPVSTGGSAGWLGFDDARSLLDKLGRDEPMLATSNAPAGAAVTIDLTAHAKARTMLEAAVSGKRDLCLILSG